MHQFDALQKTIENKLANLYDAITTVHEQNELPPEAKAGVELLIVDAKKELETAVQATIAQVSEAAEKEIADAKAQAVAQGKSEGIALGRQEAAAAASAE